MVQDEAVYQQIRDHVLSRSLAIADALDPVNLASQSNAAISSVYYALTRLTSEGLASRDMVKGYVIVSKRRTQCSPYGGDGGTDQWTQYIHRLKNLLRISCKRMISQMKLTKTILI